MCASTVNDLCSARKDCCPQFAIDDQVVLPQPQIDVATSFAHAYLLSYGHEMFRHFENMARIFYGVRGRKYGVSTPQSVVHSIQRGLQSPTLPFRVCVFHQVLQFFALLNMSLIMHTVSNCILIMANFDLKTI